MKVLLSINPQYVGKIFSGEKKYEYRRSIFKKKIDTIVVYSTMPEGKVVGEFQIEDVMHDDLESIWNQTNESSGISYSFFKEYFINKEEAYAIKIGKVIAYETPYFLQDIRESLKAPQSFCYID